MHVVAVDPEQRLAVLAADDLMGGPELVDQGLRLAHKSRAECICWANINEMRAEVCRFRTLGRNGCLVNFRPSTAAGFCSPRRSARRRALLHAPAVLRAQGAPVKVGVLHPVSGALSYSGQQGRIGAQLAIEEINAAGGIKALGGAKIEAVLGDAQSTPEGGNAEVEKMNGAGVAAVVGGYASGICLAASQTAARYDLPYIVDVGVVDSIVSRGLKNTFRFGPGFGVIAKTAIDNLVTHQRSGQQGREDRDDRARGLGVRRGPGQAPEHAAARARLPGA